jgi:hypothetical protein
MKPQDTQTLINQIASLPPFLAAIAHCQKLQEDITARTEANTRDVAEFRRTVEGMKSFFGGQFPIIDSTLPPPSAEQVGIPVPFRLDPKKTPSMAPRKHYEKVRALIGASKAAPHFSDICAAWESLCWEGCRDEKFKDIVRAAIRTAKRHGHIKHQGGHNGTYHLT